MAISKDQVTAIILAAGQGKRLMPITRLIPKPLVQVDGEPILLANLRNLAAFGIARVVVVYGRPTALLPDFLDAINFGKIEVAYAFQTEQRGTGDALLTGMNRIADSDYYLLMAGDTRYSQEHVSALWDRFSKGDVDGGILLKQLPLEQLRRSSVVTLTQDGILDTMISKPSAGEVRSCGSNLADASLHIYSRNLVGYLKKAELSRSNELEVTTALKSWVADGARIAGVVGKIPPHITDLNDFIIHNVPFGRQLVTISEIERSVDEGDDRDISALVYGLQPSDIWFVYKRLKKLSEEPMGTTRQARVLALISEILRHQAQDSGSKHAHELDEKLANLAPEEFIAEVEPELYKDLADPVACHYLATAYARHTNKLIADNIFAEALARLPESKRPDSLKNRVRVRIPARLAFSSSQGSDVSYIIEEKGALILNCAIKVNGEAPGTVTIERISQPHIELVAENFDARATLHHYDDIFGHISQSDPLILLRAGLRFSGLINPKDAETLQDWLKQYECGIRITVHCSIPKGSGLGCSAVLAAGLVRGLREFAGLETSATELLVRSYCCERYYGRSGYQDIIGGSVGGVKLIQADGLTGLFAPTIQQLELTRDKLDNIADNLIIFYTGKPHHKTPYLLTISAKYFCRSGDYMYAYENGKQLTHAMAEALHNDDWDKMGKFINDYWNDREFFEPGVTPDYVRKFRVELAPWTYGTALCGSGHGGYMMIVPQPGKSDAIETYLADNGIAGEQILDFEVSRDGLQVTTD